MGGSQQITPNFLTPPDIGGLRPQYAGFLNNILGGGGSQSGGINRLAQNPLQAPIDPLLNQTGQQYSGLLGAPNAYNASQNAITQGAQTGNPTDFSSFFDQGKFSFNNFIAPSIKDQLGAGYGINFGTPQGEELARAGAQSTLGAQTAAMPYMDAARQRQLSYAGLGQQGYQGLLGGAGGVGQALTGANQTQLSQILSALQGGVGSLSGQSQFQYPQYGPSSGQQNLQTLMSLAAIAAAFA